MTHPGGPQQPYGPPPGQAPYGPPPGQTPYGPPPSKKRKVPVWLWVIGGIVVIAIIGSAIGAAASKKKTGTTASAPRSAATDSPAQAPTGAPSAVHVTKPPAAVATTPPFTPKTLLSISGSGTQSTQKFTTGTNDWDLAYSYDCSGFVGGSGNFIVDIYNGDGTPSFENQGANELGAGALKVQHYHSGGTFYLQISSECSWTVKALTAQ